MTHVFPEVPVELRRDEQEITLNLKFGGGEVTVKWVGNDETKLPRERNKFYIHVYDCAKDQFMTLNDAELYALQQVLTAAVRTRMFQKGVMSVEDLLERAPVADDPEVELKYGT